jgi:hypothetical protein
MIFFPQEAYGKKHFFNPPDDFLGLLKCSNKRGPLCLSHRSTLFMAPSRYRWLAASRLVLTTLPSCISPRPKMSWPVFITILHGNKLVVLLMCFQIRSYVGKMFFRIVRWCFCTIGVEAVCVWGCVGTFNSMLTHLKNGTNMRDSHVSLGACSGSLMFPSLFDLIKD